MSTRFTGIVGPQFSLDQIERIRAQTTTLPRPRLVVTDQIPPPGSIVPKGTVVQVVLTDINGLTLEVLQPDIPDALKGVRVADAARVVEANPALKQTVAASNALDPAAAAAAAQQLNTAGTGVLKSQVQAADAVKAINAFRTILR